MERVRQALAAAAFAAFMTIAVACGGPSAEQMERQWNTHQESAQKFTAKYPTFKAALDEAVATGKKDFEAAKGAAEKERGDKMQTVNDRVGSLLKAFETYEAELGKVQKLLEDKVLQGLPAAQYNPPAEAAKTALTNAAAALKSAAPTNAGEAKGKLEEATKLLTDAAKGLEALKPAAPPPAGNTASPAAANTASPAAAKTGSPTASPAGTAAPTSKP